MDSVQNLFEEDAICNDRCFQEEEDVAVNCCIDQKILVITHITKFYKTVVEQCLN